MGYSYSDYSYLQRVIANIIIWHWFLERVYTTDRFELLEWRYIKKLELRSALTLVILVTLPIQAAYDLICCYLKYSEGFLILPNFNIQQKPSDMWSGFATELMLPTQYLLSMAYAFQTAGLFLMQAYWSHIARNWQLKPFMKSREFQAYLVWTIITIPLFPIIQWIYRNDELKMDVMPQLVFSCEWVVVSILAIRSHFRLSSTIPANITKHNRGTVLRIQYFIMMNRIMIVSTAVAAISLGILCIDSITSAQLFHHSLFVSDLLIANANWGGIITWIVMILIVYPRYYLYGLHGSHNFDDNNPYHSAYLSTKPYGDESFMVSSAKMPFIVRSPTNDENKVLNELQRMSPSAPLNRLSTSCKRKSFFSISRFQRHTKQNDNNNKKGDDCGLESFSSSIGLGIMRDMTENDTLSVTSIPVPARLSPHHPVLQSTRNLILEQEKIMKSYQLSERSSKPRLSSQIQSLKETEGILVNDDNKETNGKRNSTGDKSDNGSFEKSGIADENQQVSE